uniref:Serine-threonine/tyrosine-protein kinase catalytic domain-containing protein n=1 Tax=Oryza brachyantha TaxID=4533 RepID=J3LVF9_ORYBR
MECVIVLGLWCSVLEVGHRPSMQQAMDVLDREAPLPDLINSSVASADQNGVASHPELVQCDVLIEQGFMCLYHFTFSDEPLQNLLKNNVHLPRLYVLRCVVLAALTKGGKGLNAKFAVVPFPAVRATEWPFVTSAFCPRRGRQERKGRKMGCDCSRKEKMGRIFGDPQLGDGGNGTCGRRGELMHRQCGKSRQGYTGFGWGNGAGLSP